MSTGNTHTNLELKRRVKDRAFVPQDQVLYELLKAQTYTASQIEAFFGIKQKSICRYKRRLEKRGLLWQHKYIKCPITGHWAWTLTTDPDKVEIHCKQLNLFEHGV